MLITLPGILELSHPPVVFCAQSCPPEENWRDRYNRGAMRLAVLDRCMGIWKRRKTRSHNDADAVHPLHLAPVSPYYTCSEALARIPSHWAVWCQHMQWYQELASAMALLCFSMTGRVHTANVYTDVYTNTVKRGYGWLALLKKRKN